VHRALTVVALVLSASAAHAQRYRVLVGIAGTARMSLIEFSPCIPAETSACGAWVNRVIDTATDTSYGPLPAAATEQTARDSTAAISVHDGILNVRSFVTSGSGGRGMGAGGTTIADPRRVATAVVVTGDSRYAFAVLEAKSAGEPAMVRMIDFGTKSVIASVGLADRPAGISMAP
jgi:hypothetical protein